MLAGQNKKILIVTYRDSKGNITKRDTEPYEIKDDKYFGYCLEKGSIRCFKLSNILNAEVSNENYVPRWEVKF